MFDVKTVKPAKLVRFSKEQETGKNFLFSTDKAKTRQTIWRLKKYWWTFLIVYSNHYSFGLGYLFGSLAMTCRPLGELNFYR